MVRLVILFLTISKGEESSTNPLPFSFVIIIPSVGKRRKLP